MKTTPTLNDPIAKALQANDASGKRLEQLGNTILRVGSTASRTSAPMHAYQLKPASLAGALPGIDLTKALQIAHSLEDEQITAKLEP